MTGSEPRTPQPGPADTGNNPHSDGGNAPVADKEVTAHRISHWWPAISGVVAVVLAAGLGAIIAYRDGNLPFNFDTAWMSEVVEHRSPLWDVPAFAMNWIGGGVFGGIILPVLIIVTLLLLKRKWGALYFGLATIVSVLLVQLLKGTFQRPRPQDILVVSDIGSFPSGHVANAATMSVVIGFLLQRTWVWAIGVAYTVVMMVSRTYLGAHWLSDTFGGLVVGAAVAVIVWAPLAHRLHLERRQPETIGSSQADAARI